MFMRFVSSEVDGNSHVSTGLFCAAFALLDEMAPSEYEYSAVRELIGWFNVNLRGPFEYRLRSSWRAPRAICWFRCSAHEHLARARELAMILDDRNVFIRTIKCYKTGYVLYEDDVQVLAQPFADMRFRL
ncbi:MAG: hypothetical protein QOE77_1397 [Blastocatellia bacterium]|jgi:hypothetical protein|nr:hypothetical protein [Blastocatellia bacterium]